MTKSGEKFDALCEQIYEEAWQGLLEASILLQNQVLLRLRLRCEFQRTMVVVS